MKDSNLMNDSDLSKCPFHTFQSNVAGSGTNNRKWWPNELKLNILRQRAVKNDPMGKEFNYEVI